MRRSSPSIPRMLRLHLLQLPLFLYGKPLNIITQNLPFQIQQTSKDLISLILFNFFMYFIFLFLFTVWPDHILLRAIQTDHILLIAIKLNHILLIEVKFYSIPSPSLPIKIKIKTLFNSNLTALKWFHRTPFFKKKNNNNLYLLSSFFCGLILNMRTHAEKNTVIVCSIEIYF